ncbi:hypothetical protein WJX73_006046 [Symbiochloris irregularis]|uniref:PhoD-like phosphatase domain-containing protein n=1 Tax=Symbiochloris irregularis TaxID=706552 RepID=A0AAW1PF28_9CHLO
MEALFCLAQYNLAHSTGRSPVRTRPHTYNAATQLILAQSKRSRAAYGTPAPELTTRSRERMAEAPEAEGQDAHLGAVANAHGGFVSIAGAPPPNGTHQNATTSQPNSGQAQSGYLSHGGSVPPREVHRPNERPNGAGPSPHCNDHAGVSASASRPHDVNPWSDTMTAAVGGAAGDITGAPRSDQNMVPAGPYLQFLGYDVATCLWRGTVAIVLPPLGGPDAEPKFSFAVAGQEYRGPGRLVETMEGWAFWRFDVRIQLESEQRSVDYELLLPQCFAPRTVIRDTFVVPSNTQQWHWGFHSCNGLSVNSDIEKWGTPHLWGDVLREHARSPLHVIVGGGDQVYNDAVWKCPALHDWLDVSPVEERYSHPFTEEMHKQATAFYFNHYREHFSTPLIADVMAKMPQVMVWDDHDIWDGWGSYPEDLQTCPVFIGLYLVARRAYLLFQQHTVDKTAQEDNDMFGPPHTYSFIRNFGPITAVACLDSRSERTTKRVMSAEFYAALYPRLEQLPTSTKHCVVVHTVPLVFPGLPLSEKVMSAIEHMPIVKGAMTKTGVGAGIIDKFGHAELLDDITDHWDASTHIQERNDFVRGMQVIAKKKGVRVSFLGGDVHVCAVGRFYTHPKVKHLRNDHRFMPQITSSAVWNNPPPSKLITLLHATNTSSKVGPNTREKMVKLFKDFNSKTPKVLGARNWLDISAVSTASAAPQHWKKEQGALVMTLRVEDPDAQTAVPKCFPTIVPAYTVSSTGMRPTMRTKSWGRRLGCASGPAVTDPLEEL